MSNGFNASKKSQNEYIENFFRQSKVVLSGFDTAEDAKQFHSKQWYNTFVSTRNNYTKDQLLNPEYSDLSISHDRRELGSPNKNTVLGGFNGLWRVLIHKRDKKSLDFDISVMAGESYRFHPEVIKTSVLTKFDETTYDEWRKIVNSDLDSLKELVGEISGHLKSVPWSYTCCKSSSRLCNKVGIKTSRGISFLFPQSFH